jgi:hypothetical protein
LLRLPLKFFINQPPIVTRTIRTIPQTESGYPEFHLADISKATAAVVIYPVKTIQKAITTVAQDPKGS